MGKHFVWIARALIGETRIGGVGVLLQWLTLAILISLVLWTNSLTPRVVIAFALVGVATLVGGLVLSIRGQSLGPIIVIPGALGIAFLCILTVLVYPITLLMRETPGVGTKKGSKHGNGDP